MKVSEIVEALAELTPFSKEEVQAHARSLREAGLLPQSRGRAHPDVTPKHVAMLVVALGVAPSGRQASNVLAGHEESVAILEALIRKPDSGVVFERMNLWIGSDRISLETPHPYPQHRLSESPVQIPHIPTDGRLEPRGMERRTSVHEWFCRTLGLLLDGADIEAASKRALVIEVERIAEAQDAFLGDTALKGIRPDWKNNGNVSS